MRSFVSVSVLAAGLCATAWSQSTLNVSPSRVLGQPSVSFGSSSPNVVEGREVLNPSAVAVDRSGGRAILYVSDTGNNRVLAWRNIESVQNGAMADFVIGQINRSSTSPLGPGTARTGGLNSPSGLAVDSEGNLYVVDTGNNRILRFPRPYEASDDVRLPDLVIGQPNLSSDSANQGGLPGANTIALASGASASRAGLAFDRQGNLWFTDALNHRVLRYPASALTAGANNPAADMVLGQPGFASSTAAPTNAPAGEPPAVLNRAGLRTPWGIAVDAEGRVYVSDSLARILVYVPPLASGREGVRVLGVGVSQPGQPLPLQYVLGQPQGLFTVGNRVGVADPATHRIAIYDAPGEWPQATAEAPSPAIRTVIGQASTTEIRSNRGLPEPTESTLSAPLAAVWSGTELVVADSGNHRILIYPQATGGTAATRVLGQTSFTFNAPNMLEGRELFLFNSFSNQANLSGAFSDGAGVAIDQRPGNPYIYIADTFNNRVLGYSDYRRVQAGARADIVIGQSDFSRALVNAPANNADALNNSGLRRPSGVAVDGDGNLWVADSGNGRVLRFPTPFAQNIPPGDRHRADVVLGQPNFNQKITDPSARNMAYPFGLGFTREGHLLVSDAVHSRVLFFRRESNGQFVSGQAAERVIGQPDFFSAGAGSGQRRVNSPRHLALDTSDRLYLTDSGNNRVLVYDNIIAAGNDPNPAFFLTGVSSPQGVYVSPLTGEIWVANTRGNAATRFPEYERLTFGTASDLSIPAGTPLALTQDPAGNLYIAEGTNRVSVYYNAIAYTLAANYSLRPLAPGSIGILWAVGSNPRFSSDSVAASSLPLPTELGDTEVLVDGNAVPLYLVSPNQINFVVPMNAPRSGSGEVQVVRKSTGQVLAVSSAVAVQSTNPAYRQFQYEAVNPALFTTDGTGQGQVAAVNQDGSVNSSGSPAPRGSVISLYATGLGFVPNAPPDGQGATGPLPIQEAPVRVIIGTDFVPQADVQYAGLAPGFPGLYQINVRIPESVAPNAATPVAVQLRSVPSTAPNPGSNQRLQTTIAVSQ